jgi:hypothetical protein
MSSIFYIHRNSLEIIENSKDIIYLVIARPVLSVAKSWAKQSAVIIGVWNVKIIEIR